MTVCGCACRRKTTGSWFGAGRGATLSAICLRMLEALMGKETAKRGLELRDDEGWDGPLVEQMLMPVAAALESGKAGKRREERASCGGRS